MSTLDAFGFHTQKHAAQEQHAPQSKGDFAQLPVKSIASDAGTGNASSSSSHKDSAHHQQAVPWLCAPTIPEPSQLQKPSLFLTNKNNKKNHTTTTATTKTTQTTLPLAMTMSPKKRGKAAAATTTTTKKPVTGPITRYFTSSQQNASMEIDADQRRVRKQLSFQELWQRMVQEHSQHRNKSDDDDCNPLNLSNRRRKHDDGNINNDDEDDKECCALAVADNSTLQRERQAIIKKTKITVDHEFLLKFQQLLTVNNPPLCKIPVAVNTDEEQDQKVIVVTVRRQLTVDESIAFLRQISDELLL